MSSNEKVGGISGPGSVANSSIVFLLFLAAVFFRILVSGRIYPSSNYIFTVIFGLFFLAGLPGSGRGLWLRMTEQAWLLVFFGALGISIPLGIYPWKSLREMAVFFQYLLILLATVRMTSPERIPQVLLSVVLAGLISVAMALRQYFGGFEAVLEQVDQADPYILKTLTERRVFGFTFSPDMLAGLLAMAVPLALGLAGAALRSGQKIRYPSMLLLGVPSVILLAGLILTRSLGGWLAGILGIGIFFIFFPRKRGLGPRARAAFISACAVVVFAAAAWLAVTRGQQFTDFESWDNPVMLRAMNWKGSAMVYTERPLFGVGLGNLGLAYPRHRPPRGNEIQYAHNNYLQILAETGPLGLVGLLGLGFLFLGLAWKGRESSDPGKKLLLGGMLAAGGVFLAHSFIDFDLYTPEVGSVFFMLLGLLIVEERTKDIELESKGKFLRAALGVAMLIIIAGSIYLYILDRDLKSATQLVREGAYGEAADKLRIYIEKDEGSADAHAALARALRLGGAPKEEVVKEYRMAQALNPRYSYFYKELGDYLFEQGWPQAAEKEYGKALDLYPNSYRFNLALSLVLLNRKKFTEAEEVLNHATECSWNNYDAWVNLAQLYIDQGRFEEANQALERLIARFPEKRQAYGMLWTMHMNRGDEEKAALILKELKRLQPEGPDARIQPVQPDRGSP